MPSPNGRPPVEAIRHAAGVAVEATSLRSVAAQVGMSPTGLRHFLNGRTPYSATLRKLTAWFVRHEAERQGFSAPVAQASLSVLLEAIPEGAREAAAADLLGWLAAEHQRRKTEPPPWLKALRDGD